MALQSVSNNLGMYLGPMFGSQLVVTNSNLTINAAGESLATAGWITLEGGAGSSKTISSAGGIIHWLTGAVTWANAATNLRVGIQDVGATGLQDGTFDVYADLVPGTDALTANNFTSTVMTTGTKTIAHGDLIAVVVELTARAGSDAVIVRGVSAAGTTPYANVDTGTLATNNQPRLFTIEFDDGTVGWFHPFYALPSGANFILGTQTTYNSGSTPDERALIFQLPFPATVSALTAPLLLASASSDYEMILYSTPLGTPSAQRTASFDSSFAFASSGAVGMSMKEVTPFDLAANTDYAISVRPTTANNVSIFQSAFGAANLMKPTPLGSNWYLGTRTNNTGSFSATSTTLPNIGMILSKFGDDTGGGGGTGVPYIIGG